jgi:hypothetical protein
MTAKIIEWLIVSSSVAMLLIVISFGSQIVRGALRGRIDALDLVIGKNGRISDEKIWTHAAKAVVLFAMLKDAADGNPDVVLQGTLFVAVAAHEVFIRIMAHRENPLPKRPSPTEEAKP